MTLELKQAAFWLHFKQSIRYLLSDLDIKSSECSTGHDITGDCLISLTENERYGKLPDQEAKTGKSGNINEDGLEPPKKSKRLRSKGKRDKRLPGGSRFLRKKG